MRFDAYAGNVREHQIRHVAEACSWALKGVLCKGPKLRRYGDTVAVDAGGRTAVWLGVDENNGCVYFEGKGDTTPVLANSIRAHFPEHTVSRADSCEDYDGEGVFGRLLGVVREHKGPRVNAGFVALPDDPEKGKTWSAGVRGGVAMIRVYEAGKHPDRVHLARPNLTRVELEARPHYAADKRAAASMTPLALWGLASWTQRVGEALTQVDIDRYEAEVRDKPSFDRRLAYVARTYRRLWEEMEADGLHIGKEIQAVNIADDAARAAWKKRPS